MTLFLCGFMGCGKTALGKALAKRLELPLVDMDDLIVEREGMTIPEIRRVGTYPTDCILWRWCYDQSVKCIDCAAV